MIYRKYGSNVFAVEPNFDARAMNEIGFTKGEASLPWPEWQEAWERKSSHDLVAEAEGGVQHEAEEAVLNQLSAQIAELRKNLGEGEALFIESELGKDYPKLREKVTNVVVGNENRLHFHRTIDPPLRVGVYSRKR